MAWWIFQHVVTTAVFALVVGAVCRVTRIGPVARHALWVLVLIKFVTPPLVAWPWTMPDPLGLSARDQTTISDGAARDSRVAQPEIAHNDALEPIGEAVAGPSVPASDANRTATLGWLLWLWIAGSVLLAAIEGIRLLRLAARTRAASPADAALAQRVASHASRMGLAPVPIVLVADGHAPSVWGLARPRILWPVALADQVSEVGADGLIVHELAHVKRRDHLVGWLELVGGIVWWWNPLFWSVRSALREQAELACDAWVISALPNGRRAYAESLLALSGEAPRGVGSSMAVVGISATTRRALERRLVMIMKGRASLRLTFVGVCSLVAVAVATLPTWAATSQAAQPPTAAPPAVAAPPATLRQIQTAPPTRTLVVPQAAQPTTRRPSGVQRPASTTPTPAAAQGGRGRGGMTPGLPEAARSLQQAHSQDQQAIVAEMVQKTEARREVFYNDLRRLQDELTKAGNLDDAIAIRNFLRLAAPVGDRPTTGRGGRGRAGGGGR